MPARRANSAGPQPGDLRSAARWSRTALALALLFGSLPVAARLFLGSWAFGDATLLAVLCLLCAGYLRLRAGRRFRVAPDAAALLDRSLQLAASGETGDAIAVLSEAIRVNPWLWQALQYRGELYLHTGLAQAAIQDFDRASLLAPDESHIRALREHAEGLLGPRPQNPL